MIGCTCVRTNDLIKATDFDSALLGVGGGQVLQPGPRGASFDGAYFRDLDGNKLAVFCIFKG
jgi:hypothetical protein